MTRTVLVRYAKHLGVTDAELMIRAELIRAIDLAKLVHNIQPASPPVTPSDVLRIYREWVRQEIACIEAYHALGLTDLLAERFG